MKQSDPTEGRDLARYALALIVTWLVLIQTQWVLPPMDLWTTILLQVAVSLLVVTTVLAATSDK